MVSLHIRKSVSGLVLVAVHSVVHDQIVFQSISLLRGHCIICRISLMHSFRYAFDGLGIQECCAYAVTWLLAGYEVWNDAVWETNKVRGSVRN